MVQHSYTLRQFRAQPGRVIKRVYRKRGQHPGGLPVQEVNVFIDIRCRFEYRNPPEIQLLGAFLFRRLLLVLFRR